MAQWNTFYHQEEEDEEQEEGEQLRGRLFPFDSCHCLQYGGSRCLIKLVV